MRRRAGLVLAAAVIVVGLALVLATRRGERGPGPDASGRPSGPPEERPLAVLEGRGGEVPVTGAPAGDPATPASAPAATGFRVRGRILGVETPDAGALVYVLVRRGNDDVYAARGAPTSDGRFDLPVPTPEGAPPWRVEVGAEVPGRARGEREARDVEAGVVVEIDLSLPEGETLRGRVVDLDGAPVPGLRLGLVNGGSNVFRTESLPDRARDERTGSWDTQLLATAVTDADGRFVVRGVHGGAMTPASYDDRWWLEGSDVGGWIQPDGGEVEIRARTAYRMEVRVEPEDPWDAPSAWSAVSLSFQIVRPRSGGDMSLGSYSHVLTVRGGVPDVGLSGFAAALRVDTMDHLPGTREVEFGPGAWSRRLEVALRRRPAGEYGTLVIGPGVRDAAGEPARLRVLHHRQTGERSWAGDWRTVAVRGDGRSAVSLPAGRQQVEVRADVLLGELVTWKGEIEVARGREAELAYPTVPVGRARIHFPPEVEGQDVYLSLRREEPKTAAGWQGKIPADGLRLPAMPEGTWTLTWLHAGAGVGRTFVVEAGAEAVVDLAR